MRRASDIHAGMPSFAHRALLRDALLVALLGAVLLLADAAGAPFLPERFLGAPSALVLLMMGFGFLLSGGVMAAFTGLRASQAEATDRVMAAFLASPKAVVSAPREEGARPARRERAASAADPAADEIAVLTRELNRASVLMATGKLSREGYARIAGDIKARRARLEAQRAAAEAWRS